MTKFFSKSQINFIQARAAERITEIFDAIGLEYNERHDYLQSACPVHGGDNPRSMFWAIRSSHWECKTRNCHRAAVTGPSNSLFGLVRGAMSYRNNVQWTFHQAVFFVAQVLGLQHCEVSAQTAEDIEVAKALRLYRKNKKVGTNKGMPLSDVIAGLEPDVAYYTKRGISPELIARYHISYCDTKGKPFYKRAFFPILDETGKYVSGWSARSVYEECEECGMHHHPARQSCPESKHSHVYAKWKHSKGFRSELCLYNYWYAKYAISKTAVAVICEGPGDVWAYERAGIHNSVAILGSSMSKHQRLLLQNAGALTIVCTFDNDNAGRAASNRINEELCHYFRIFCITPDDYNDVGDMLPDDINRQIGPVLRQTSMANRFSDGYGVMEKNV